MYRSKEKLVDLKTCNNTIKNKYFLEQVELYFSNSSNKNDREITFERCFFNKGVLFNILRFSDVAEKVKLSFVDCIISPREKRNEKDRIIVEKKTHFQLLLINCFVVDLNLKHCKFQHFLSKECIFYKRLSVSHSDISVIAVRNSFGKFFISYNRKSKVLISYSDKNVSLPDRASQMIIDKIIKEEELSKIFEFETKFYLSSTKEISVIFEKKPVKSTLENSQDRNRHKYHLDENDLSLLNISLSISSSASLEKLTILDGIFEDLSLNGEFDAVIEIRNTKINRVFIHDFRSTIFSLYNLKSRTPESLLEIKNSDLTDAWLNKVDFSSFNQISFYRSTLESAKFSSCQFPSEILALENIHYPEKKENDYFENVYDNYKQLKIAFMRQHDQLRALQMHEKMYKMLRRSSNLSYEDKIILLLNQISNRHGTSIVKPLILFVLTLGILYFLYVSFLPTIPFRWGWESWQSFIEAIKDTFYVLKNEIKIIYFLANPAHSLSELQNVTPNEMSFWHYFLSFISRILMGWVYYQFIIAFRKFGRNL